MKFLIMTDLEGICGVDSFKQTRTNDNADKGPAMKQLARETNACIAGIRRAHPNAEVTVIDGHGSGGLFPKDLEDGEYVRYEQFQHDTLSQYRSLFYVGQHAMEGTINAPLRHTFSSVRVQYYRLNGVNIGEFGAFANWAGLNGVPTIFLAGDDKATLEAQMFVPGIETVVTKYGKGLEAAVHRPSDEVLSDIEAGAARAIERLSEIPPFVEFQPPFVFEARYYKPIDLEVWSKKPNITIIDERTIQLQTASYRELPFLNV
ncbi:M55 family metallopeptidase [Paenibacillus oceani]|uniref:M55 family metallopeptidase n=1 Tax=Paenibacillus oceani TaxID=2772510 RepID=A0A927CDW9_9BACL|nr:M55 family metallopeptidase [Paenibacillus oceani]MBD2864025.1 M55 family metallopeptidase [Paenibacillus oceani]